MHMAFLFVAVILFVLDFLMGLWSPPTPPPLWRGLTPLGLAFFAAAFIVAT